MTLTEEQARAIQTCDVSIALSAGAGCGKTYVLTQRFLAQLDPRDSAAPRPADLSELVAITFTDRAAREMRERIRLQCYQRLRNAPPEDADYWLKLLRSLDRARVSTIHSFCTSLLRAHAVQARLDPQFAVMDGAQQQTLAAELVDDALRLKLAQGDELTVSLVSDCGLERLRCYLFALLNEPLPERDRWLAATPQEQAAAWAEFHKDQVLPVMLAQVQQSEAAREVLSLLPHGPADHRGFCERRATLLDLLPRLHESRRPVDDLDAVREAAKVVGLSKKSFDDGDIYETYKEAAKKLRDKIDSVKKYVDFDAETALPAAEVGLRLFQLSNQLAELYEQKKRELVLLDFSDLIARATRLLTDPDHQALRRAVSSRIQLLLVDEFQDTDPLQVELVKALCGDGLRSGRLFFVGDFKQSIYRFRGANPHVFRQLQEEIPENGRMPLTLNFRSQPAILDFANALFCESFGQLEPLRPHRRQVTPQPAVELLWAPDEGSKLERGATERMRRREADWIARRLRALLDGGEKIVGDEKADPPQPRALRLGDVAILFRALTDVHYYEEALRSYGLDYYLVGGHAFYNQQEIFDLLNLLRALAHPDDGLSLAGVLRSPFFSLSDEALFWLAQHRDGLAGGLFAKTLPAQLDEPSRHRAAAAARTLAELRARKDRLPLPELIQEALARTGYDAALLAEFLGERKLANLRKLIDGARSFTASGTFGLADFIVQLSQFVANQPREPLAATHPESTDVIRLMTIHQAKGLEFPLVVVPDLERSGAGRSDSVAYTPRLGPLVKHDAELPLCGLDLYNRVERFEEEQEAVRLFYVACTRAADYLILSSGIFDLDKPQGDWTKLLASRFDLRTGAPAAALPQGFALPQVAVTLEEPHTDQPRRGKPRGRDLEKIVDEATALAREKKGKLFAATAPIAPYASSRRAWSFSRLTGRLEAAGPPPREEALHAGLEPEAQPDEADPLALGSLAHAMLEEIDLASPGDVASLARRLAERLTHDAETAAASATDLVSRFLGSPRAAALAAARQVYREIDFLLSWPPGDAQANGRYLQGTIDCLYQDREGGWHVLDYKTNVIDARRPLVEVAAGYEAQLYVYALAAEQVLKSPPRSLVLHFLRPGGEVTYEWNDQARARLIERVNSALAE